MKRLYKFASAKVISESSQPPGGSLINLVSSTAHRKHSAELQPCSARSSIAHRAKGTRGSAEGATLLIDCLGPCVYVCVREREYHATGIFTATHSGHTFSQTFSLFYETYTAIYRVCVKPTHLRTHTHRMEILAAEKSTSTYQEQNSNSFRLLS